MLNAKGPFNVNDKYPYKFKVKEAQWLKYPGPVIEGRRQARDKPAPCCRSRLRPRQAGKKQIAGQFDFSVCTTSSCLIEKRELALAIDVK